MKRIGLLDEMLAATSPDETWTSIYDVGIWVNAHPDDMTVWSAMEDMIESSGDR